MKTAIRLPYRFRDLPEAHQRLIRTMQALGFGSVGFHVQDGLPDLDRPWCTHQTIKMSAAPNGPRPELRMGDFELCKDQVVLLEQLARVRDGARVTVEVRHGLPFTINIEQTHRAA